MASTPHAFVVHEQRERYGEPMLVRPRLGQGAFRVVVTLSAACMRSATNFSFAQTCLVF